MFFFLQNAISTLHDFTVFSNSGFNEFCFLFSVSRQLMGRQLRSAQRSVDGKNWVAMLRKCKQKIRAYSVKRKKNRKTFDHWILFYFQHLRHGRCSSKRHATMKTEFSQPKLWSWDCILNRNAFSKKKKTLHGIKSKSAPCQKHFSAAIFFGQNLVIKAKVCCLIASKVQRRKGARLFPWLSIFCSTIAYFIETATTKKRGRKTRSKKKEKKNNSIVCHESKCETWRSSVTRPKTTIVAIRKQPFNYKFLAWSISWTLHFDRDGGSFCQWFGCHCCF